LIEIRAEDLDGTPKAFMNTGKRLYDSGLGALAKQADEL
jgi:hypothetical protein